MLKRRFISIGFVKAFTIVTFCCLFLASCGQSQPQETQENLGEENAAMERFENWIDPIKEQSANEVRDLQLGYNYFFKFDGLYTVLDNSGNSLVECSEIDEIINAGYPVIYYLRFIASTDISDNWKDALEAVRITEYQAFCAFEFDADGIPNCIGTVFHIIDAEDFIDTMGSDGIVTTIYEHTSEGSRTVEETLAELYQTYFPDYIPEQYNILKSAVETNDLDKAKSFAKWFEESGITYKDSDALCAQVSTMLEEQARSE